MEKKIAFEFEVSPEGLRKHLGEVKNVLVGVKEGFDKVEESARRAMGSSTDNKQLNKELRRTNGLIEDIEENIKKWGEKARKATNVKDIQKYNRKIAEGRKHLEQYRKTGVDAFDKVNKKTKESSDSMKKLTSRMTALISAAALYRVVNELKNTALSLDILDKKAKIVFGEYIKDVKKVGKATAESMGMTEAEFLRATSAAGDLLIPMQFTRKEAASMSVGLVTLSGALSEWSAGKYTAIEVSEILTKSLLGEREQLKSLGTAILDSEVTAKLAEKGQTKLTGAALAQAKALATLELLYFKSTDAQASFEGNSGSLSRTYAELSAKLKTVRDNLSSDLIPTFNRMFGFVNRNTQAVKTFAKWLGVIATAILGYKVGIAIATGVTKAYTFATNLATAATRGFDLATKTTAIGAVVSLLATAAAALLIFRDNTDEATGSLSDFDDELDDVSRKLGSDLFVKYLSGWDKATGEVNNAIEKLRAGISDLTRTELESLRLYLESIIENTKDTSEETDELLKQIAAADMKKYTDALELINIELKKFGKTGGIGPEATSQYKLLTKEIKELETKLRDEIAANSDNVTSTARLLAEKKKLLQTYEDTYEAITLVISEMKKLDIDSAQPDEKPSAIFDTDYLFGEDFSEEEFKKIWGEWFEKILKAKEDATPEISEGDGEFSFWQMIGIDPDSDEGQEQIAAIQEFTSQIVEMLNEVIEAEKQAAQERVNLTNTRIAEAQRDLQAEIALNEQGFAANIQAKQKEVAALKAQREKNLRDLEKAKQKQILLDSAMQLSGLVTASVNIFKTFSTIPIVGIPLAIAMIGLMLGSFVYSKAKAIELTKLRKGRTGLIRGKSHEQGGENFEVEGDEYHSITPKNKAKKHLPLLEAIRTDDKEGMKKALFNIIGDALDKSIPDQIRNDQEQYRLHHAFTLEDGYVRENNRLLNEFLTKPEAPVIDSSDSQYTKLIFANGNQKWIMK